MWISLTTKRALNMKCMGRYCSQLEWLKISKGVSILILQPSHQNTFFTFLYLSHWKMMLSLPSSSLSWSAPLSFWGSLDLVFMFWNTSFRNLVHVAPSVSHVAFWLLLFFFLFLFCKRFTFSYSIFLSPLLLRQYAPAAHELSTQAAL